MGFAENLRDELEYQGMQVKELAERTGLSINTLNKYRPGSTVVPTIDNALKIAKALHVSLDYLAMGRNATSISTEDSAIMQMLAHKIHRFSPADYAAVIAIVDSIAEKYERQGKTSGTFSASVIK